MRNLNSLTTCAAIVSLVFVFGASKPVLAETEDTISKLLLMGMIRDNTSVLCESEQFTQCMGFTADSCIDLLEQSIKICIDPLPDSIKLTELENSSLEACPQKVYSDAGFTEEKAEMCLSQGAPESDPLADMTDEEAEAAFEAEAQKELENQEAQIKANQKQKTDTDTN